MKGDMYLARSKEEKTKSNAEYGGAVTALLRCLLTEDIADAVLTVKTKGNRFEGLPVLISEPSDLEETAGTLHCVSPNIPRYLKEYCDGNSDSKIAVVGKPCDIRGIIEMAKREAVDIEKLFLIGVNCTGTMKQSTAKRMFEEKFKVNPSDVVREEIEPEENRIKIRLEDGTEKEKKLDELEEEGFGRRENCRRCDINIPKSADLACGKWGVEDEETTFIEVYSEEGSSLIEDAKTHDYIETENPSDEAIERREEKNEEAIQKAVEWQEETFNEIQDKDLDEKYDYWIDNFDRCIKCFSCRDACPICYCEDCILEVHNDMVPGGGELPPEFSFSMIRVTHVMDSCVNCGQCEDVCPAEIPLSRLTFMMNKELEDIFGYEPGVDLEDEPPLTHAFDDELEIEDTEINFSELKKEKA